MTNLKQSSVVSPVRPQDDPAAMVNHRQPQSKLAELLPRSLLGGGSSSDARHLATLDVRQHIRALDAQDAANSLATFLAALRDESNGRIDFAYLAAQYYSRLEERLPPWPQEASDSTSAADSPRATRRELLAQSLVLAQRTRERRRLRLEAGLAGVVRWYGPLRCIHSYPRVVGNGSVLSEKRQVVEQRMTDRVTGQSVTWSQRAWNGRRVEEVFTMTQEVDVETTLETHTHSLANARRHSVSEALRRVPMPPRIRRCLEVIAASDYAPLYYVAVGDLYDATVQREALGRRRATIEKTGATIWYSCEPAIVFAPLGVVEAGWLDALDE